MNEKPSPLFLVVFGTIGTALLSTLTLEGIPFGVLIIPFAILATLLYNGEKGIIVGIGISLASGVFIHTFDVWGMIAYALGSTIMVLAYDSLYSQNKNEINALVFVVLGTLLVELLNELTLRETVFFRSEFLLGSGPYLGAQLLVNALVLWAGISTWNPFSTPKK